MSKVKAKHKKEQNLDHFRKDDEVVFHEHRYRNNGWYKPEDVYIITDILHEDGVTYVRLQRRVPEDDRSEESSNHGGHGGQDPQVSPVQVSIAAASSFSDDPEMPDTGSEESSSDDDPWIDTSKLRLVPEQAFDVYNYVCPRGRHPSAYVLKLYYNPDGTVEEALIAHPVAWGRLHRASSESSSSEGPDHGKSARSRDFSEQWED